MIGDYASVLRTRAFDIVPSSCPFVVAWGLAPLFSTSSIVDVGDPGCATPSSERISMRPSSVLSRNLSRDGSLGGSDLSSMSLATEEIDVSETSVELSWDSEMALSGGRLGRIMISRR